MEKEGVLIVDVSPYKTLLEKLPSKAKIMVDDNVRSFITQNLIHLDTTVLSQSQNIAAIRETKSPAEITILRAVSSLLYEKANGKVNIATVEAIRAIHKNILIGMTELVIRESLSKVLIRAGLTPYFNIVLFGEDAANPHGGVDESRQLQECEFILIDVGN